MMSVRPLPVTATFKPIGYYDRLYPGLTYQTQGLSDYSDGSTESLTSILHHDSYSDSNDEETNGTLAKESWKKLRCRADDEKSDNRTDSPQRWPAGGNRAITKEFVSSSELLVSGDVKDHNAPDVNGVTAMVYVHQASRQKRFIAAKRPPSRESTSSVNVTPRRPLEKSRTIKASETVDRNRNIATVKSDEKNSYHYSSFSSSKDQKQDVAHSVEDHDDLEDDHDDETGRPKDTESHTTVTETWDQSAENLNSSAELTPWEKWLLTKERHLREKQLREQRRKVRDAEKKKQSEKEKEEKLEREQTKIQEWLDKKNKEMREKRQRDLIVKQQEKMKDESMKKELTTKAEQKYREWYTSLQNRENEMKSKQEEEQRNKAIQDEEKKNKANEAYQKWLEGAKHRPTSVPYSYGFADGKLTGYYDKSSNPPPSYVNPRPWVHPNSLKSHSPSRRKLRKS